MIGFDAGTYNLVCCSRDKDNKFSYKREVNAFLQIPLEDRFLFNMMKNAGVPLIERDKVAYALGESAVRMAYTMSDLELRRPMSQGCVNPKERDAFEILKIMIHSLIEGSVKTDNEPLYYSVPANALNEETDADYHSKILQAIFKAYESDDGKKITPYPINEALALVYAELSDKNYTGIGVSCLIPGTKIYTKDGIKNIEEVKEGDLVLTHKGRWRKVNNVVTKQFDGISTKIQLQGYVNNCDFYKFVDNHELYVKREGEWKWVGCENVIEGDIVGEPIIQQDRESLNATMTICEKITSSPKINKKCIQCCSNVQRLMGYFLTDGSVNEAEGCIQFDFGINETENILDVQEILQRNFDKSSSPTKHGENCTRVKCYSRGLVNWFRNRCYDKNGSKFYPWAIEKLTRADIISLLIGLIRGDGDWNDNSISFYNTNTKLVILAKQLFSKLGLPTSISFREPRESVIDGRIIKGKKHEWTLSIGAKTATNSLKDLLESIDCNNSTFAEKLFIEDGFCCSRIQQIKHEEYNGIVYDLQVEDDHSFSGPFLTIHNCGAGMVNVCFAMFGASVFQFALVNSGDHIDKMAAKATGESSTFINKEKTKVNLAEEPISLVHRAIQTQYRLMIEKTATGIKKGLSGAGKKVRSDDPVDMVIAGGTSLPIGFDKLFKDIIMQAELPIKIGNIIRPADPLFSVSRGCLIAAENSTK